MIPLTVITSRPSNLFSAMHFLSDKKCFAAEFAFSINRSQCYTRGSAKHQVCSSGKSPQESNHASSPRRDAATGKRWRRSARLTAVASGRSNARNEFEPEELEPQNAVVHFSIHVGRATPAGHVGHEAPCSRRRP